MDRQTKSYATDIHADHNSCSTENWCVSQQTQCPLICLQTGVNTATTRSNTCDWKSLTYSCVCNNGLSPNVSEYSQTLPFYICQEWGNQCVNNCNGVSSCQSACRQDHPCGAQHPTLQNTSTLTSTSSAAASASSSGSPGSQSATVTTDSAGATLYNGLLGNSAAATGTQHSAGATVNVRVWALSAGKTFGSLAVMGALFGGFAVLL